MRTAKGLPSIPVGMTISREKLREALRTGRAVTRGECATTRFIALLSAVGLGLLLIGSASAQVVAPPGGGEEQKLVDLTPLVGTWKGWFKSQTAADVPMDMTVRADGSYSGVIYFRPRAESFGGNFSIEEGGIKAATSKGQHQRYWLYTVKGKRVLTHNRPGVDGQPWYRDTELEWVK